MSTATQVQRERLDERFRSEISWREGTIAGAPDWYQQLLTDLLLATGGDCIRYFSARLVPSDEMYAGSVSVVAFTDDIVAYANFEGNPAAGDSPLEVIVTARKSLSTFSLESIASDGGATSDTPDLSRIRITVTYPHFSRMLPLGASDWKNRARETAELITCLRRDVVA